MRKNHETNEQQQGGPLVSMCYSAGTGSSVLDPFPSVVVASLRAVDHRCCTPLLVEWWWWKNPLSRVGHTQVAAFGAFSKTGGRRGSYVPFGHIGSRVQPQQGQRWRVEMCIFEWCEVVIGGLIEPSAGSRQWWNPGFSRVEKVACR